MVYSVADLTQKSTVRFLPEDKPRITLTLSLCTISKLNLLCWSLQSLNLLVKMGHLLLKMSQPCKGHSSKMKATFDQPAHFPVSSPCGLYSTVLSVWNGVNNQELFGPLYLIETDHTAQSSVSSHTPFTPTKN